jgi:hypothetical protein
MVNTVQNMLYLRVYLVNTLYPRVLKVSAIQFAVGIFASDALHHLCLWPIDWFEKIVVSLASSQLSAYVWLHAEVLKRRKMINFGRLRIESAYLWMTDLLLFFGDSIGGSHTMVLVTTIIKALFDFVLFCSSE